MDATVGGIYKMSFTNFTTRKTISFGSEYRALVPNERLRYTDNFDDPNLPGEIQVTVTLKQVLVGTELNGVQEGLPAIGERGDAGTVVNTLIDSQRLRRRGPLRAECLGRASLDFRLI